LIATGIVRQALPLLLSKPICCAIRHKTRRVSRMPPATALYFEHSSAQTLPMSQNKAKFLEF
jgi:hypothetical protein